MKNKPDWLSQETADELRQQVEQHAIRENRMPLSEPFNDGHWYEYEHGVDYIARDNSGRLIGMAVRKPD